MVYLARFNLAKVIAIPLAGVLLFVAIFFGRQVYEEVERDRSALPVSAVSKELVAERIALIARWISLNQHSDGTLPYWYDPGTLSYADTNNVIRQLITAQGLFALARVTDDESLLDAARRSEVRILEDAYREREDGTAYLVEKNGDIKLGAAGLGILMIREGFLGKSVTDRELRLGELILSLQRDDGSFQTFLKDEPTDENDRFYSGEALAGLATLLSYTDDPRYDMALKKGLGFYRNKLERDFFPQYAPWHMQAYSIAYKKTHNVYYRDYVYWLADRLIETMLHNDPEANADEVGRFFNPERADWGPPHSSSTGVYVEGLTYAYEVAKLEGDIERAARFRDAIILGTRALLQVQWTPESVEGFENPERLVGAFKATVYDNTHRIDQLGHSANVLARVFSIL